MILNKFTFNFKFMYGLYALHIFSNERLLCLLLGLFTVKLFKLNKVHVKAFTHGPTCKWNICFSGIFYGSHKFILLFQVIPSKSICFILFLLMIFNSVFCCFKYLRGWHYILPVAFQCSWLQGRHRYSESDNFIKMGRVSMNTVSKLAVLTACLTIVDWCAWFNLKMKYEKLHPFPLFNSANVLFQLMNGEVLAQLSICNCLETVNLFHSPTDMFKTVSEVCIKNIVNDWTDYIIQ